MIEWEQHAEVAFQGEPGAYSETAVYRIFGPTARPKPKKHFSDVFRAVWTDSTKYGVVPIENSIEGSVNQVYDLFLQYDLKVCGELALRISHCLIADPETDLEEVKVVYSHPQALGQCRNYLERLGIEMVSTYDTAGSVKMIKEQRLTTAAAIAGERAAEIYGMKILAQDIADTRNNYTRFFVLAKNELPPTGNDKTSIIFSTKHVPRALYESLGELANRGINMTKIESRPTKQNLWEYNFYLDFDGHMNEQICAEALNGLRNRSLFVKVLGSYPRGIE
ncbi:MAG: prephenate dehydratase [Candidatus Thorarchaeota archaeon]|nr:MAG: prephenate dehydratase [Candidatus Thorarchaeota archaeon]